MVLSHFDRRTSMHVSEINIYPIKSLRGIAVESAEVRERGLRFDRRWMLVDEQRQFMTQREFPVMATIGVAIDGERLIVSRDGSSIDVPFEPDGTEKMSVKVWSSSVK